jgi:hypothetical protein
MDGLQLPPPAPWPSIDTVKPEEQGGPAARGGFDYQDEVAVSFLIDMLADPGMVKIHLETHDDIVVVRSAEPALIAEYIQVKAAELNKLWSVADLCHRDHGPGSSIFEVSLARDRHCEVSRFRLVTVRPVVDGLKVLTYPLGGTGREPCGPSYLLLHSELLDRCPGFCSAKKNGPSYWLKHCHWDIRESRQALAHSNFVRLLRTAFTEGRPLLPDQTELVLDELRAWAKQAGEAKWEPDRSAKIIAREQLRDWWEGRITEPIDGAATMSGGKLASKMRAAALADDQLRMAIELRREYGRIVRTSRYMEDDSSQQLQSKARVELASLRAKFVAGQFALDAAGFHALCIEQMKAVNEARGAGVEDHGSFLLGCMYDITDRCLHRFERHQA